MNQGRTTYSAGSQRTVIEGLKLPQFIKDMLIENNNSEFYNILGVEQFAEYITACLADMAIHVCLQCAYFYFKLCPDSFFDLLAGSDCETSHYMRFKSAGGSLSGIGSGAFDFMDCRHSAEIF